MRNLSRAIVFPFFVLAGTVVTFSACFISAAEKIDINTAPLEDLTKIVHIGEVRAQELISLRPFSSLDDLVRIKGIGEKRVEDIKKQGLAWVEKTESEPQNEANFFPESSIKSGVIINEILPSPEGPDETEEWIEILNQNNFDIDLSIWKIEDIVGRKTSYVFPEGIKIEPLGFLVLSRPTSKITLNNDADGLNLFQPDGNIIDSVSYEKALRGQSYNKTPADWTWSTFLTPGSANIIPIQEVKEAEIFEEKEENRKTEGIDINTASPEELEKLTGVGPVLAQRIINARPLYSLDELTRVSGIGPKTLEDIKKQGLARVDPNLEPPKNEETESPETKMAAVAGAFRQSHPDREFPKTLSLFLVASALAVFSGIVILILKKKLKPLS